MQIHAYSDAHLHLPTFLHVHTGEMYPYTLESLVAKNVTTVQKLSRTNQTHNIPPPLLGSLAGRNSTFSLSRSLRALMLNADVDLVESDDEKTKFSEVEDACKSLVKGEGQRSEQASEVLRWLGSSGCLFERGTDCKHSCFAGLFRCQVVGLVDTWSICTG